MIQSANRILITGGSGYLGEQLVLSAIQKGFSVTSLDILKPESEIPGVRYVQGDIRNLSTVTAAIAQVDFVVHAVASVPLRKSSKEFLQVNVGGTRNVLQAALSQQVKKAIYVSSSAVYGVPQSNPVGELSKKIPAEDYGRAKLAGEEVCYELRKLGLDVTIIRPRTILGMGRLGIFGILFEWIRDGASVPVIGKGQNVYQFVHVHDLVEAIFLALGKPGASEYNIGASNPQTMKKSLEELCKISGSRSTTFGIPQNAFKIFGSLTKKIGIAPFAPYHWIMYGESLWFDGSKAQTELAWEPKFTSTEALVDSFQTYLKPVDSTKTGQKSPHRSVPSQGILKILKFLSRALLSAQRK